MTAGRESKATILLVEDDPNNLSLFARALMLAGYHVIETSNGRQAVSAFEREEGRIDLLLTDMRMPDMGGRELIAELRARRSTLKVLCFSGHPGFVGEDNKCVSLMKPFSRKDLLQAVSEALKP